MTCQLEWKNFPVLIKVLPIVFRDILISFISWLINPFDLSIWVKLGWVWSCLKIFGKTGEFSQPNPPQNTSKVFPVNQFLIKFPFTTHKTQCKIFRYAEQWHERKYNQFEQWELDAIIGFLNHRITSW